MQAIKIQKPGHSGALKLVKMAIPKPKAGQLLIRVKAAGLNQADILQRRGQYPAPPGASLVPGLEVAGVVEKINHPSSPFKVGDKVCALLAGGGYSEYAVADVACCFLIPPGMRFREAAALPEALFTCWLNLFESARLNIGESVLIHGGSGGMGSIGVQMASLLGATVFTTAGNAEKVKQCKDLGAHTAINYRTQNFVDVVMKKTNQRGVNVVLDFLGGAYLNKNLAVLTKHGVLQQIGVMGGREAACDVAHIVQKNLKIQGMTLRDRSRDEKAYLAAQIHHHVWPFVLDGRLVPVVDKAFALKRAAEAQDYMSSGKHFGKIVLNIA